MEQSFDASPTRRSPGCRRADGRLTIDAPGNNRAVWEFRIIDNGETVTVATDAEYPSKLVLPVVTGVEVPEAAPPACGSLRGEPCRTWVKASNGG